MPERVLFLLEDNRDLILRVQRNAERFGFDVQTARSLESAKKLTKTLEKNRSTIAVALIDLMIPRSENELDQVDRALEEREELAEQLGKETKEARRSLILRRMADTDAKIRDRVGTEGGIEFLDSDEAKILKNPSVSVAIFSALRAEEPSEIKADMQRKEYVKEAIGDHWDGTWFEKPILLRTIRTWLADRAAELNA